MTTYAKVTDGKIVNKITTEDAVKIQKLVESGYIPINITKPEYDPMAEKVVELVAISKESVEITYKKEALDPKAIEENLIYERIEKLKNAAEIALREQAIKELTTKGKLP